MHFRSRGRERSRAVQGFHGASSFDADAQAYFMEVGLVDPTYTAAINQFVLDLKAASLWTKFDRLWILANANATAALTCIKSLEVMTPVNNPTFTAGQGYAGNGSTSYLNTGFVPSTDGVNYTLNSASLGFYSRTSGGSGRDIGGVTNVTNREAQVISSFGDSTAYCAVNQDTGAGFASGANADASGLFMGTRTASNALALYKNGVSLATASTASSGLPAQAMFVCALGSAGGPSGPTTRQEAMAFFGDGFDGTAAAGFKACVDPLKTAIGF